MSEIIPMIWPMFGETCVLVISPLYYHSLTRNPSIYINMHTIIYYILTDKVKSRVLVTIHSMYTPPYTQSIIYCITVQMP